MSAKVKAPDVLPNPNNTREVLSYNMKLLRFVRGWSQEELASLCELDRTYVSAIERMRLNVSLSSIEKIASIFGMEPWQLLMPPQRAHLLKV